MDAARFDSLTRRLSDPQSRRWLLSGALRGIVAGAAAAVTGASLGRDETEAKKKAKAGRKKGGKKTKNTAASSQSELKVTLCFQGKTITVAESAVPALLQRGARVGSCDTCPVGPCTPRSCGLGCSCLDTGGGNLLCLATGPCSTAACTVGSCGDSCTCVNPGGGNSGCAATSGCPVGQCSESAEFCGPNCVCVGSGDASRCASLVIA